MKTWFQHNRLTRLLNISYPIIQGGMVWCSTYALASSVSQCGGLGVLGAGSYKIDALEKDIQRLQEQGLVFGVNIPLQYAAREECITLCERNNVPVVITSAGSPRQYTKRLQRAGCIVGHVVSSLSFAHKAVNAGVDFLIAEGVEAGGHNGIDGLSTLVLVQMIRRELSVPLVGAGGIFDGAGLVAVLALGGDGVQMGTRFACSVESSASLAYKQKGLDVRNEGTILAGLAWSPTRMMVNTYSQEWQTLERAGANEEKQRAYVGKGKTERGIALGDIDNGELEIGQIASLLTRIESVKDIFNDILHTYHLALTRVQLPHINN